MEIQTVLSVIVIPLIGISLFMLWKKLEATDKELLDMSDRIWAEFKEIGAEVDSLKYNYLNRFDDLKNSLNSNHLSLIERITILESRWASTYELISNKIVPLVRKMHI